MSAEIHDNEPIADPINLAVPGKKLFDICRSLTQDQALSFELDEQWLTIRVESKFKLMTMPVDQF